MTPYPQAQFGSTSDGLIYLTWWEQWNITVCFPWGFRESQSNVFIWWYLPRSSPVTAHILWKLYPVKQTMYETWCLFFFFFFFHSIRDYYSFLKIFLLSRAMLGFLTPQFHITLGKISNTNLPLDWTALKKSVSFVMSSCRIFLQLDGCMQEKK